MKQDRKTLRLCKLLALGVAIAAATAAEAQSRKEFKYTVAPGATIMLTNGSGDITIRPAQGKQVMIAATPASDKVEVDAEQSGNRVEVRTHNTQKSSANESRVDYEISVPADASLIVRTSSGSIRADGVRGSLSLDGDAATIEVRNLSNGSVQARTVNGPITLDNVARSRVELRSVGGDISMTGVYGSSVTANTTGGGIRYTGNFEGDGRYNFTTASGPIEVTVPGNASAQITARSINGSVDNTLDVQKVQHTGFSAAPGKGFTGLIGNGSGASSFVLLNSFSGTVRVKKP